jgi:hypothetical protein
MHPDVHDHFKTILLLNLGFCGSVHLKIFNKTTNQMHNLIFIALSRRHHSTYFGHCCR